MDRKDFVRGMSAILGAVAFGSILSACGSGSGDPVAASVPKSAPLPVPTTPDSSSAAGLDAGEVAGLMFMREEEKLAHDVYVTLHNTWGANVFANIAESETAHTEAVLGQIESYGLDDPADDNPVGVFSDAYLQALYNRLVEMGSVSLVEALKVGALIEETDIRDIRERMALTDELGILLVYQHLLCGSYEHLQAFDRQLRAYGVTYEPQVISREQWDAIASGTESCSA